jgi:hypothetical protein
MKNKLTRLGLNLAAVAAVALTNLSVIADGTETLGPASIPISSGTGILAAGTGLYTQPNTIELNVPAGSTVKQVILYWEGNNNDAAAGDSTIVVNGNDITGTSIGGPTVFFGSVAFHAFRADITGLGLVTPGANVLTVSGMDNTFRNNGAGVLVVVDDGGTPATLAVRDGLDLAFFDFAAPLDKVVPQAFTFAADDTDRTASLSLFFSSVGVNRPNEIKVTTGGVTTSYPNLLNATDGDEWDTINLNINIPSGASSLTIEAISTPSNDPLGASFAWIAAGLAVTETPDEEPPGPGTGTPGFWKNHPEAWPINSIVIGGTTYTKAQAIALMQNPTKTDKTFNMFEQLVASILNVLIGNESSCIEDTIESALDWMEIHPVGSKVKADSAAWAVGGPLHSELDEYNNGLLCAPARD